MLMEMDRFKNSSLVLSDWGVNCPERRGYIMVGDNEMSLVLLSGVNITLLSGDKDWSSPTMFVALARKLLPAVMTRSVSANWTIEFNLCRVIPE